MLPADAKIISVDDHLVEPPQLWQDRLPSKMREEGPRIVHEDDCDAWLYEGRKYSQHLLTAVAGKDFSEWSMAELSFADILPGCFDPKARLRDMDADGVAAQINFPTWPRLAGTLFTVDSKDKQLALQCVKAWNDYVIDEWCATAPHRYIPLVIVPLWDPALAAKEIERTAAKGAKTVSFVENPAPLGLPSFHTDHWDPFFATIEDLDMPVCLHFGSSGQTAYTSPDAPRIVMSSLLGQNAMSAMTEIIFSPVLHKFPKVKFVLSESGIGWIPYLLERLDQMWTEHRHYQDVDFEGRPTDLYNEHFWVCTITETFGLRIRDEIGVDRIMLESDYPHADSSWPHTRKRAEELLADLPDEQARMISETNARNLFHLEGI